MEITSHVPTQFLKSEIQRSVFICASDLRDRVIHHAICNILEPIFEKKMIFHTYACRPNKGSHLAIKTAQKFARRYKYFLKCDIKKCFESIDHEVLKNTLARIIKDKKLLGLLNIIINHAVPGAISGKGLPIGNLTSQHFANLYLGKLDHFLKDELSINGYIRYMDDFIIFHDDKLFLKELLSKIEIFIWDNLKLKLKEKATTIAPVTEGVPFLGVRVFKRLIRLQRPNLVRFRRRLRFNEKKFLQGRISKQDLINSVNSMFAHISHANTVEMRRKFCDIDFELG